MDKRFLTFTTLAFLIIVANLAVMTWLRPPGKAVPQAKVEAKDAPAADDQTKAADHDAQPAEVNPAPAAADDAAPKEAAPKDAAPKDAVAEAPAAADAPPAAGEQEPAFPERWVTIGSANPQQPYRMLATIASRGAAVERIELNNGRYRDLDINSGYLGHLEATDEPNHGGARVRLVGFGVPAAEAGLKEGDVIQSLAGEPTPSAKRLWEALGKTKPGDTIKVAILRDGAASELSVKLGRKPLDVVRPEYERKNLESIDGKHDPLSLILTLDEVGADVVGEQKEELPGVHLLDGNWEIVDRDGVHPTQSEVTLERTLASRGVRIRKTFTLAQVKEPENADDPAFHLKVKIEVTNLGTEKRALAYRILGPTGLPIEGQWYANKVNRSGGGGDLRTVDARVQNQDPAEFGGTLLSSKSPPEPWITPALDYAACDSQYFAAAMIPEPKQPGMTWFAKLKPLVVGQVGTETAEKRLTNVSFQLTSVPESVAPGASLTHNYTLFAGPKRPNLLGQYGPPEVAGATRVTLRDLVYYGWPIFGLFAEPMQRILHVFYSITSSYGLAILMLTVLVRGAMFPLSRRQAISTQKMQDLQPEIKRINEKFKKDPQAKNKAVQELFRKNNCNPLGGCLPALIQLPIFMGLYRSLAVDVELRQAPLLGSAVSWCSNLAAPDMLWDWFGFVPAMVSNFLGPYFNILPLITIGLFILQQRMFMPPPADEQAAMQQKMMQFMMVFMGVMFFKVASGLCVYFIASSVWSICERKLIPKTLPSKGQSSAGAQAANPGGNGAPARRQRERK